MGMILPTSRALRRHKVTTKGFSTTTSQATSVRNSENEESLTSNFISLSAEDNENDEPKGVKKQRICSTSSMKSSRTGSSDPTKGNI